MTLASCAGRRDRNGLRAHAGAFPVLEEYCAAIAFLLEGAHLEPIRDELPLDNRHRSRQDRPKVLLALEVAVAVQDELSRGGRPT